MSRKLRLARSELKRDDFRREAANLFVFQPLAVKTSEQFLHVISVADRLQAIASDDKPRPFSPERIALPQARVKSNGNAKRGYFIPSLGFSRPRSSARANPAPWI
jgi:hypothetical protein